MSYIVVNGVAGFIIGWALGGLPALDAMIGFAGLVVLMLNQAPRFK